VGEGAEAHDLQPGEAFGVSAWAKARWPAGPQPGAVAVCSLVHVGVGEGFVACSSGSLSTPGGLGHYWAAQWHLTRAVGKRFRGCHAKRLYVYNEMAASCMAVFCQQGQGVHRSVSNSKQWEAKSLVQLHSWHAFNDRVEIGN